MSISSLDLLDATAQAELVRRHEASPLELIDAAIQRIERVNPQLNAVVWKRFEKARAEAKSLAEEKSKDLPDGPFRGVPFLTKDLGCATAGEPDSSGSRFMKSNGYIAGVTSELARRIKAAGFINLGRTNTPEFGAVPTTESLAWGPARNPWDLTRTAAGSSGGSCAAVAALMVPVAHGSDGGGSIRIPSAACGVVGLKGTRGRVSIWPSTEWLTPVSVHGFQTRTVRDLAACMDFASGSLPGDPMPPPLPVGSYASEVPDAKPGRLRIGLWNRLPATTEGALHPECQQAVEETGRLLESLGHRVELAHPPILDDEKTATIFPRIWPVRLLSFVEYYERKLGKKAGPDNLDPDTLFWLDRARGVSATDYLAALEDMDAFTRILLGWWQDGFDVLVSPTTGTLTPKLGEIGMDPVRRSNSARWWPFTAFFNMSGQPAISLPLHWAAAGDGVELPVGVQIVAAYSREDVLFRLAAQLEQAQPWSARLPPVHA